MDSDIEYYSDESCNYDEYKFECTNIDPSLAKIIGIDNPKNEVKTAWKPPTFSGLENSTKINNGKNRI